MILAAELPTRILVIDDKSADALVSMLSVVSDRYISTAVSNGREALQVLEREPIDIVLSDLVLAGSMDGVEVTAAIRQHFPNAQVIVFSGQESSERKRAVLDAGAFMYLVKPIEYDELRHAIDTIEKIRKKESFGEKFKTLTKIAYELQETLAFDVLAERIVQGVAALGFDRARLYLFDEKRQVLVGKASTGMAPSLKFSGYEIPFTAQPIIKGVFEADQPTVWNREELRKRFSEGLEPWLTELGLAYAFWIDCPLVVGSRRIGTLSVDHCAHSDHPGYLEEDVQVMGIMAGLAAHSLNNATLYQREQIANASFNSILKDSPDAVITTDLHGIINLASPSIERLTGIAPEEIVGRQARDFYADESGSADAGGRVAKTIMKELEKNKLLTNYPISIKTPSGNSRSVLMSVSLLHDAAGLDIGTVGILKEAAPPDLQTERYRNLLEGFGYGTVLLDPQGKTIFVNSKAIHLLQRSEKVVRGLAFSDFLQDHQRSSFLDACQQVLKTTRVISLELSLERPSGHQLPVQAELTPYLDRGEPAGVQVALYGTKELAALMQSGRLMALGEMLTNMAHEANNPLNNLRFAFDNIREILSEEYPEAEADLRALLEIIDRNSGRIADLIRRLKEFARPREFRREPVRVRELIDDSLALFGNQLRDRNIAVLLNLAEDARLVFGEPTRLQQVLVNLIANASEAMEGQDSPKWIRIESRRDGDQIVIRFQDGGPGVPISIRTSLFEPFVTAKASGRGTGLGLAISKSILDLHGGDIDLINQDAGGACFEIRLHPPGEGQICSTAQEGIDDDNSGS